MKSYQVLNTSTPLGSNQCAPDNHAYTTFLSSDPDKHVVDLWSHYQDHHLLVFQSFYHGTIAVQLHSDRAIY